MKTFANLPNAIETAIADVLSRQETSDWVQHAVTLHELYTTRDKPHNRVALKTTNDVLAYVAMRIPATYAQLFSALANIQELVPSWQPKNLLDLGSGPGTASWAAKEILPTISESLSVDQNMDFLRLGQQIANETKLEMTTRWEQQDLRKGFETNRTYDLVVIANVLNELSPANADKLIGQALNACTGILVIIEPGTPFGFSITQNAARKLSKAGTLLAPYVGNAFVASDDYFIHFPQRFIRPDFQRRVRQHMRDASSMASDWEETKYAYTVITKIAPETNPWGRIVGPIEQQKGFLEVPVLTKEKIEKVKVMKRDHEAYTFAKELKWGQILLHKNLVIPV